MARYQYQLLALALFTLTTTLTRSQTELRYARVADIDTCDGVLVVESPQGFRDGDMILVHQAHGAEIDANGSVKTLNGAGQFEFAEIDRSIGTQLYLRKPLTQNFHCNEGVQVCRVITSQHVRIASTIRARPFADGCGGIIVIVADTITLNAKLDAIGCGFPGGDRSISGWDTCVADGNAFLFDGTSGGKGRSVARASASFEAGRTHFGNGGGGGNARNAGGGGGGGGNNGGHGGNQTSEYEPLAIGGEGGRSISDTISSLRLIFGGGGGGGHQNDFGGSEGGSGGGVILLKASVITCLPDGLLEVNGENASDAFDDGAGGGGGGGLVVVIADTIVGVMNVEARGGNGGDAYSTMPCMGTGGGGSGGGVIIVQSAECRVQSFDSLVKAVNVNLQGGIAGKTHAVDVECEIDSTYGAKSGDSGSILIVKIEELDSVRLCADPDVIVSITDAHAPAGVVVEIPLEVDVQRSLLRDVSVRLRIRTRANVLMPNGPYWWAGRRAMVRYITVNIPEGPPRLITVPMEYFTALGDSASVSVTIDSMQNSPTSVRVVRGRNGVFTLDGVCDEDGRQRLFDPFETLQTTEKQSGSELQQYFELYDIGGRRIETTSHRTTERIYWKRQPRPQR